MVKIHRPNNQRFVHARHCGDIVLDAQGEEAISQESLPLVGGWMDWTGSGGVSTKQLMFAGGHANSLWGTDAALEGAKDYNRNVFGERKQTHRTRRKKIYIKLD